MSKQYYVYIMTNKYNRVLYAGVTSDLVRRTYEHRTGRVGGFTRRYNSTKLVYYEVGHDARSAIAREKQIKAEEAGPGQRDESRVDGPIW
jgi:putative endonuclease